MYRIALILFFALCSLSVQAAPQAPGLQQRVTDLTRTLKAGERREIENQLRELEKRKGSQVAVLIMPSTGAESIESYAVRVFEHWKLGRQGIDDGVLLLVAKDDRTLRIEVGYGLEGAIPDALAARIIREQITPAFKEDEFFSGIKSGVTSIVALIDGEPLPAPWTPPPSFLDDPMIKLLMYLAGALILLLIYWLDPKLENGSSGGSDRDSGGSGGSGGSDGGFSGGGGSSGGGGASGRW